MSKQLRIWLFALLGTLLASTFLLAEGVITMTTSRPIGEPIGLAIQANGGVTIKGAQEFRQMSRYGYKYYKFKSQTIIIQGDVTELKCDNNKLTSLDVSGCTSLTKLECYNNQLTSLDLSKNTALIMLNCSTNQLTSLDVSDCTALTSLDCGSNQLTSLDVSGCTALTSLDCGSNQLTSLDVSQNRVLKTLLCAGKSGKTGILSHLNVSGCIALTTLDCSSNQLTSLDVSDCTALTKLECYNNPLTSINLSGCQSLKEFSWTRGKLTSLDVSGCTALTRLYCGGNQLTSLDVSDCPALTELNCIENQLTSLDASSCTALTELSCSSNPLTSINLSSCQSLKEFSWTRDKLTSLNVSGCTALTTLYCYNNQLTSLDVSGCTALTELECGGNQLTSLNVTGCTALTDLRCYKNQLSSLPLSACISLTNLGCYDNQLTSLDVSDCRSLKSLSCARNKIKSAEMSQLINSLPNRRGYEYGSLYVVDKSAPTEENFCYQYDMNVARYKNWSSSYPGEPNRTCSVTKTLEGKGTLSITGATDLGVVAYGTELTVVATPDKNYELIALTANGVDITATKKFLVKDDVIVKAVFKGNDFKVSLEQDGEGDLSVTGVDNLDEVPYGTELTIIANPKKGYELTSLIANGINITETKKVTVRGNLTIKATFTQKTRNFVVSLTKEGEGTITATGADDLSAVAYGTELTIVATPAEGYELTALIANGTDILASKKVTIKEAVEVKATFTKKAFAVSLTKEGEGMVTATGADDLDAVAYGTELTIVATPAEGYELTALTANGTDILASQKVTVKEAVEVKATFTKKNFVVTLEKAGEGDLSTTGIGNLKKVPYGTELTIIATPAEGYELQSLVAGGVDITATKKIVVKDNLTVKATFSKKSFAVTFAKEGEGTISAMGATSLNAVAYGTELTINATPATGYELTALTANGTDILATKKIVVTDNMTVKATFEKKSFAVTFDKVGEGTITATGASNLNSVAYGTELTINATPAMGYELVSITAGGTDITASKKVVVTGNLTVKATFAKKAFAVSLTKEGEGTISATGASSLNAVVYGTELTIVATPAEGYELTALTANGTDILATKKIVVEGNLTVKATFTKKSFAVSLTKEGEGTISAMGTNDLDAVAYGTELTIVATPAKGYELQSLVAGGVDITATKKIVVKDNLTVKATFAKKRFAVSLTKEGEGTISATGATSLNAVAYGTELTINATPAKGYELTALTANGTDILASKKVIVKEAVEVKATFTKKNFAVSLTKEGEGTISATGADDLNAVAYGTELTIVATPAEGYELTALTANGTDILATKKIVVKDNMTVKATFTKKNFAVSLTKEGEGTITATGASDLNSVAYGTELTIVATPAEGYELTALTANGTDILATKKIVVADNLTIKATFTKKTFAVTLTSNEHGEITIVEPVDLKAVPYGTTLTVKATGKNAQCVLTELTANGEDILATQSFVVTDVTEVKATFVDHMGVERTVKQQTQLYPNPATDYVIVEGVAPASEVTLHSMTGERLYAGRADSRGTLQIDLTPYADGVYLVCVAGDTYRVVVRH